VVRTGIRSEVIVEPRQAELLLQLALQLRGARQAAPGVSLPRLEARPADTPPEPILKAQARNIVREHRTRWEPLESGWPLMHRSF
jgi:hypothetical protein